MRQGSQTLLIDVQTNKHKREKTFCACELGNPIETTYYFIIKKIKYLNLTEITQYYTE